MSETIEGWVCENPECGSVYAEYVNGCPKCWHERGELVCGVRHQSITLSDVAAQRSGGEKV